MGARCHRGAVTAAMVPQSVPESVGVTVTQQQAQQGTGCHLQVEVTVVQCHPDNRVTGWVVSVQ